MPHFNIHWQGSPHYHLPRIRSASVGSRNFAQIAAEEVLRSPLSPVLEQERTKQRIAGQGERGRSPARTTASQRRHDKENTQSLRRSTSSIYLASKLRGKEGDLNYSRIRGRSLSPSRNTPRGRSQGAAEFRTTNGTDGTNIFSSTIPKFEQGGNEHPAVNTHNALDYWTSNTSTYIRKSSENQHTWDPAATTRSGVLDGGTTRSQTQAKTTSWDRIYDPRIDPHQGIENNPGFAVAAEDSNSSNPQIIITSPLSSLEKDSRETFGEGDVWETLDSNREHSNSSHPRTRISPSILRNFESGVIFRTPSQTKALKRFTKELDLHWQAVRSLPKQTILASPSITTVSAYTIGEFLPFHTEFQAAGLSVTSKEQRRLSSNRVDHMPSSPPPSRCENGALANKEHNFGWTGSTVRRPSTKFVGNDGPSSSVGTASTGTTIIGFTPPHEKHLARRTNSSRKYSSASTTSIGFTPPHELYIPKQPPTRPAPVTPTRSSLPWLRKADQSTKASPSATKVSNTCTFANCKKPRSSRQTAADIEAGENSDRLIFASPPAHVWQNTKYEDENSPRQVSSPPYKRCYEVATQTEPLFPNAFSGNPILYSDVGTQTGFLASLGPNFTPKPDVDDENTEIWKDPGFSGRSKSFPITSNSKSRVQNNEVETKSPQKPQKTSTGHDHGTQTPENEYFSIPNQKKSRSSRHRHLTVEKQQHEQSGVPLQGLWPFGNIPQNQVGNEATYHSSFPGHSPLAVSRCTQCDVRQDDEARAFDGQVQSNSHSISKARHSIPCQKCDFSSSRRQTDSSSEMMHENKNTLHAQRSSKVRGQSAEILCSDKDHENAPREKLRQRSYEDNVIDEYARRHSVEDPVKRNHRPHIKPMISPPFTGLLRSSQHHASRRRGGHHSYHPLLGHHRQQKKLKHNHSQKVAHRHSSSRHRPTQHHHHDQPSIASHQTHVVDSSSSALSRGTRLPDQCVCTDPQVFHGLHIAAVACCDSTVDSWIEEVTGRGVRSYLADLSRFDALGVNSLATAARISARQRGIQYREYQQARGDLGHMGDAVNLSFMDGRARIDSGYLYEYSGEAKELERRMNFAIGLESAMTSPSNGGQRLEQEVINDMRERKDARGKER